MRKNYTRAGFTLAQKSELWEHWPKLGADQNFFECSCCEGALYAAISPEFYQRIT